MATPQSAEWNGTDVDVTTIERQISALWSQMSLTSFTGAVRTSICNLVVYTDSDEAAKKICQSLDQLAGWQPSRVVILVGHRMSQRCAVDARVTIQVRPVGNSGTRLCYERLVVLAYGRAADHIASVVIPLLLPEIPTYLWWPGYPPFGHRVFNRLLSVADQLVVDSAQFQSPGDGLADVARLSTGRHNVSDFHWTRLAPWREIVAQFFDGPSWLPYAEGVVSVQVTFGTGGHDASAASGTLLLLGWVACKLGWEPETTLDRIPTQDLTLAVLQEERLIPVELYFRDYGPKAAGRLMCLTLLSQPKGMAPARFVIERHEDLEHASVKMEVHDGANITRVVPLDLKSDIEILAGEVTHAGHDSQYHQIVEMASRMAGREVWMPA